jgi:hypothetical protein
VHVLLKIVKLMTFAYVEFQVCFDPYTCKKCNALRVFRSLTLQNNVLLI